MHHDDAAEEQHGQRPAPVRPGCGHAERRGAGPEPREADSMCWARPTMGGGGKSPTKCPNRVLASGKGDTVRVLLVSLLLPLLLSRK